jgi:hypothetical protein
MRSRFVSSIPIAYPTSTLHSALSAFRLVWATVAACIEAWSDAYAASALYQELRDLSDAELERRGIARGELGRHIADLVTKGGNT